MPWWPRSRKSGSKSKAKHGAAAVSAATSPRDSVDLDYPTPSPTPRARDKPRGLDSPAAAPHRGRCFEGLGKVQYKLPVPVSKPEPPAGSPFEEDAYGLAAAGCSSASGSSVCSLGSLDEALGQHVSRSTDRVTFGSRGNMSRSMPQEHLDFFEVPVRELRLRGDEPSNSEASCSRGRRLSEDVLCPRTGSPSAGPKSPRFSTNNAYSRDPGFSPRSPLKIMGGLRSPPHPLPLPPAPAACSPFPPSPTASSPVLSSPAACSQSQSHWKKGKLLGCGTFGQVYLGFNSESGQFCAIKEVQVIADDPHSKERLKQLNQEIDMLRQPTHPNIVQYYGSEMTDDTLSIYLEYVSGGSIHKLLREYGPFKEPVIRNYTGQILCGLAYLHGRNTVHRDIKGANILVGPNGEVKLADFGMAKHISPCTEIRSLKGSPYWMAPEVILNKNGYSLPVDIWSLGCTIVEMATARPPWHQHEGVAAIFKIANSKDIPEIPDSFSEEGKSFLQLCLKRDPASRFTAAQLMGHPFVKDHPAVIAARSSGTHTMANREFSRSISPLRDIGLRGRDFSGFSTAVTSPRNSSPIPVRANMSLPVSPSSSPMRQFKQSNRSCLPSPPHPMLSSGASAYNPSSYVLNQASRYPAVSDPLPDVGGLRLHSPYGSPRR